MTLTVNSCSSPASTNGASTVGRDRQSSGQVSPCSAGKVAGRLARQSLLSRRPLPDISFVLEMLALTRPIGGRRVRKEQLRHLLDVARLRHVKIQLMSPERESHPGLDGPFVLLENAERRQLTHIEGQGGGFFVTQQCVEVATCPHTIHVRDSKDVTVPAIALSPAAWSAFLGRVDRFND